MTPSPKVLLSTGSAPAALVPATFDELRADEVFVRIEAVGVCHTDLVTRAALGDMPAVLGHEGCGIVERVGSAVVSPGVGDRVVLSFRSCGECGPCTEGAVAYCARSTALNSGGRRTDGTPTITVEGEPVFGSFFGQSSFATHAVASASQCVVVGDVPPEVVAPLGCGFLTGAGAVLNVLRPGAGDRVLITGAGGVGVAALLAAVSEGADVVAVDPLESRRQVATSLGATAADSVAAAGRDFAYALDTTGRPDVIAAALKALAPLGTAAVVGLGPALAEIDVRSLMLRGLTLRGSVEGDADPQALIPELVRRYLAGRLPLDQVITTYALADFERAVADQAAGRVLKPVLLP